MKSITVNLEQKLFVIPSGGGYSCLGFDVCRKRSLALAKELCVEMPVKLPRKNSLKSYEWYLELIAMARQKNELTGWRSESELYKPFIGNEGKRVEVTYNWNEKERFTIGKSTGFIPCHLMIKTSRSHGGGSVLNDSIKSFRFI